MWVEIAEQAHRCQRAMKYYRPYPEKKREKKNKYNNNNNNNSNNNHFLESDNGVSL